MQQAIARIVQKFKQNPASPNQIIRLIEKEKVHQKNLVDIFSAGGASHVTRSHHTDDESGVSATSTFWNLVNRWYTQADKIR